MKLISIEHEYTLRGRVNCYLIIFMETTLHYFVFMTVVLTLLKLLMGSVTMTKQEKPLKS